MLVLRARRTSTDTGGRIDLMLDGPDLAPQLQAEPAFFEVVGSDITDLPVLDGFVGGLLHYLMESRQDLHVEGRISKTAVRNLTAYQRFWSLVQPNRCSPVRITADEFVDDHRGRPDLSAAANYSGGVDSTFTVLRHSLRLCGMESVPPQAVVIVHGFDVSLADREGFARMLDRLQPVIEKHDLKRYVVRTNLKEMAIQNWLDSYSAQLVACLHTVSHRHSTALLASDGYAQAPVFEYGGNPISVPLLTSSRMKVLYDGGQFGRTAKVALLAQYPYARRSLKFCWEGPDVDRNCGRCLKCLLTYMNFRAVGVENPECFDNPIPEHAVGNYRIRHDAGLILGYEVLEHLSKVPALDDLAERFRGPLLQFERETGLYEMRKPATGVEAEALPDLVNSGTSNEVPPTPKVRHSVRLAAIAPLNGGRVAHANDFARIEADPANWAYSAAIPGAAFADMAGPARIEIRLQAECGKVGVLVLKRGSSEEVVAREQCVGSWRPEAVTLRFEIPRIDDVGDVVFRGWPGENTGSARVFSVDLVGEQRRPNLRKKLQSIRLFLRRPTIR